MAPRVVAPLAALALAAAFPWLADAFEQSYYIGFASRVLAFALAATSLTLLVGFGGLVSFGHAAFFGAGAYTVAILAQMAGGQGGALTSAVVAWPTAVLVAALLALFVGAISLRTRGLYFIMITLAFAQMAYYFFISLKSWGGDDGISLARRSAVPGVDLADPFAFYYVSLALLVLVLALFARLVRSRFGAVLQGIRENEPRMQALGYPTYRYRLVCFVIAGAVAGLAGALLVNQNGHASPGMLAWHQSGQLLVMVILGGVGSVYGGAIGATTLLVLEEVLSNHTQHWPLAVGALLLLVVLRAPRGIAGLLGGRRFSSAPPPDPAAGVRGSGPVPRSDEAAASHSPARPSPEGRGGRREAADAGGLMDGGRRDG